MTLKYYISVFVRQSCGPSFLTTHLILAKLTRGYSNSGMLTD